MHARRLLKSPCFLPDTAVMMHYINQAGRLQWCRTAGYWKGGPSQQMIIWYLTEHFWKICFGKVWTLWKFAKKWFETQMRKAASCEPTKLSFLKDISKGCISQGWQRTPVVWGWSQMSAESRKEGERQLSLWGTWEEMAETGTEMVMLD